MFKQPNFNRTCEVAANAGGVNKVLVLDTNRKPLMPCHPRRARKLLEKGRASVFKRYPFTIILHDRTVEESELQDVEIKIDQGSKTTGIAIVVHGNTESTVAFAAHTNSIRLYVMRKLSVMAEAIGSVLAVGYGYTTSKNRIALGLPKDHWIDAAVCTDSGIAVKVDPRLKPLIIKATGRGSRQFCRMDKYGFPRTKAKPRTKNFFGFKTGDIVKVVLPGKSKNAGDHIGRIAVRSSGYFDIVKPKQKVNFHHRYAKVIQQADGYIYD